MVRQVAERITIPLTVGGGVSDLEVIEKLLEAGASKVSINTAAVDRPEFLKRRPSALERSVLSSRSTPGGSGGKTAPSGGK